jgi:hypothetical protein
MAHGLRGIFFTGVMALAISLAGLFAAVWPAASQQLTGETIAFAEGRGAIDAGNFAQGVRVLTGIIDNERSTPKLLTCP